MHFPRFLRLLAVTALLAGGAGWPAAAVENYDACVALAGTNPEKADIAAQRWIQSGGGAPARHCRALALMAQGAEARAAELMVAIAAEERALPDAVRAEMLVEAGDIFLGLGDLARARAAAENALRLAPEPRPALVLYARVEAEAGNWQGVIDTLDRALARGEPDAEILIMRASARLHLGRLVDARADLAWAAELDPDHPALWLERGALEAAAGDRDAARAAWLKAIELGREGPVAAAARLRLQRMETGAD